MAGLILFVTCALLVIAGITICNLLIFPRLKVNALSAQPAKVSVMIPARNEAAVIADTVRALLTQDYPNFEVLLLDDNSDDGTGALALAAGKADSRLRVMQGQSLPHGWMGKNWACHQMAQVATGDILLFTDADVRWQPTALSALVAEMTRTQADLYTVWPTQTTVTWAERLTVPLMAVVVLGYLPILGTHYVPLNVFGAANGQCMGWRRNAYQHVGGHQAVRDNVLEDVTMARMVKAAGLRLRMADGNSLIGCRMYRDWPSVRDGYAKNIMAGYGGALPLAVATVFHWLIFLFPWVWLLSGQEITGLGGWPLWPFLLVLIGLLVRAATAAFTHQRVQDALLMPLSVMLMTLIALRSFYWHFRFGGPQWKGRTIVRRTNNNPTAEFIQNQVTEQ
ncbi:MAG: glycosyltransferase [bacterium]|nr:glycosyltransferase [bacterium]